MRIKIIKDGPYHVTGNILIKEMIITPENHQNVLVEGRILPQQESYFLCRCGKSKKAPYCDGTHGKVGFCGEETASKKPYSERITDITEGSSIKILDDDRCAYARFCHRKAGSVWELTEKDNDPFMRSEAIKAATECPAGRLEAVSLNGEKLEKIYEPEIIILQDPTQDASAGIFVKGPIVIESADGNEYEVRNRVTLCRCGESGNKPFCDATHINAGFNDSNT